MVTGAGIEPDADLAAAAGAGDERASDELYRRHHAAVLGYARGLVRDQHLAEDLASEAFARTLAALRQGGGPREACRPYLYTVVRNAAVDWARTDRRTVVTDQVTEWAAGPPDELPDVDELDALVRAFRSLPERWQTVLWHTVIEDEPVQRVAEILGMEAGAVAQLAFRAREGLRQAFLAASCEGHPDCAEFTAQLAASVRRPGRRRSRALRRHLESCPRCRRTAEEMADLNGRLRRALPIGAVLLSAPTAPFGSLAPAASLPGWAVPAGLAAAPTAVLGVLFATGGDDPPGTTHAAPPTVAPAPPASPAAP
ncbi:RNA polymerase sigma factor, partial [Actinomadura napierensis]|uniref:RNA polymerase sigma factor n=1 Tax=Actinomadura napierensis TaxID=267854 RepID=UPI0031DC4A4E